MTDVEIWLQAMLVIAGICVIAAAGLVIATGYYLLQARKLWRQARRGPQVMRDHNGRPIRERI